MAKVSIKRDKCKGCLLCVGVCSQGGFTVDTALNAKGVKPVKFKDGVVCKGCGVCLLMCPDCAIELDE